MKRLILCAAIVVCGVGQVEGAIETFSHGFNMYGDYTEYLYSVTDAEAWTDYGWKAWWPAHPDGTPGIITYRIPVPFEISSATFQASYVSSKTSYSQGHTLIDVSPDGDNWTNIVDELRGDGEYFGPEDPDITSIVSGSDVVFIRATLHSGGGGFNSYVHSRFLVTHENQQDVNTFQFFASGNAIPEPSTLIIWSILGSLFLTVGYWRKRRNAA